MLKLIPQKYFQWLMLISLLLAFCWNISSALATPVQVSNNGMAFLSVVHKPGASQEIVNISTELASKLSQITISVTANDGNIGIVVGKIKTGH